MLGFQDFRSAAVALLAATALAGCSGASDPASEAPVELKPGQYQITMSGGGMAALAPMSQGPGALNETKCVRAGEQDEFLSKLAKFNQMSDKGCSHDKRDRVGNGFGGAFSCATDADRAPGGSISVDYAGVVAAESVTIESKIKFDLPESATASLSAEEKQQMEMGMKMMDNVSIILTATRTGDCG